MSDLAQLPFGVFQVFGDNELLLKSLKDDPPKFRMESPGPGRWLGGFSFGRDGNERVLVGGKLSEDGQRGEFGIWCYDPARPGNEDAKMGDPVLYVTPTGVSGGTPAPAPAPTYPNKLVSPDGTMQLDIQNKDALNMTLYDMTRPEGDRAVWSILTGWIHRP